MNEIEVYQSQQAQVINFEEYAMSKTSVLKQIQVIQDIMSEVMHKDEHYGTIPGTEKQCPDCKGSRKVDGHDCKRCNGTGKIDRPSLYKPGAEKLSLTFRLRPEYDIRRTDLPNGHREYEVVCTLFHIPTGQSVGQGVGSATTMEGKYRFRPGPVEFTGRPVPKEYWKDRDLSLIGGKGFSTKKNDSGQWEIVIKGESVEHDNPADYYNTVLKMAKKRAHVDAILTATAASDIFTQDVEDMPEVIQGAAPTQKAQDKAPLKEPQKKQKAPAGEVKTENVMIRSVEEKSGEKNGKTYTIYTVIDENGEKYGTFDSKVHDLAQQLAGGFEIATITFTDGQYGRRIETLTVQQSTGTEG